MAFKGGDVAATFAGAASDFKTAFTLKDHNSTGTRLKAVASLISEVASPVSGRDVKTAKAALKKCSFDEVTPVHTLQGYKEIGDIQIGDFVLARNDKTGKIAWRKVTDHYKHWHDNVISFIVEDENGLIETIITTTEHPFFIDGQGWVVAGEVEFGQVVSGSNAIDKIIIKEIKNNLASQYAYNLTVDIDHTFFVGYTGMWVHNACKFPDKKEMAKELNTTKRDFHDNVKKEIKADHKTEMKKINSTNPDIGITDNGNVALRHPKTKKEIETDTPLDSYKK